MKTSSARAFSISILMLAAQFTLRGADTNPPPRLTVELADGSRVNGTSGDRHIRFHSNLLGDLKLNVKDICSVDYVSTNSARLTTGEGDTLTVTFADSSIPVETSFGKINLRPDSVRHISVFAAESMKNHPPGLVGLWPGEGNGRDVAGHNDAQLMDMGFDDGQVGKAFSLNGVSSWMKIPANSSLDVGQGEGMTITAWIKPMNVISFHPILEWNAVTNIGVQLWLGQLPQQHGVLYAGLKQTDGNSTALATPPGTIEVGKFQQVALTYDKGSGMAVLFVNGVIVARENVGIITPETSYDLLISRRPGDHPGDWTYNTFFNGLIDEIGIYNRALSATEIRTLCQQENHGKMPPPPNPVARKGHSRDIILPDNF